MYKKRLLQGTAKRHGLRDSEQESFKKRSSFTESSMLGTPHPVKPPPHTSYQPLEKEMVASGVTSASLVTPAAMLSLRRRAISCVSGCTDESSLGRASFRQRIAPCTTSCHSAAFSDGGSAAAVLLVVAVVVALVAGMVVDAGAVRGSGMSSVLLSSTMGIISDCCLPSLPGDLVALAICRRELPFVSEAVEACVGSWPTAFCSSSMSSSVTMNCSSTRRRRRPMHERRCVSESWRAICAQLLRVRASAATARVSMLSRPCSDSSRPPSSSSTVARRRMTLPSSQRNAMQRVKVQRMMQIAPITCTPSSLPLPPWKRPL
eukprot:m.107333 g.107333  ORF g.107333 m.107333 type:complete len:319 (-) comp15838_c0_seq1:1161-2117(-)